MALFFKTRKPKQFEYIPRYYDEEKEKQEERKQRLGEAGEEGRRLTRGDLRRQWQHSTRKNPRSKQSINFIVYLIIIAILLFIIFF